MVCNLENIRFCRNIIFLTRTYLLSVSKEFGDSHEHATGIEKWELEAKKAGNNVRASYCFLMN